MYHSTARRYSLCLICLLIQNIRSHKLWSLQYTGPNLAHLCACRINSLRPRQNGRHFADDTFRRIFFNENLWTLLRNSLKIVPKVRINNIPALVQIMAWRRPGDKPLSEPMMVRLLTHICVTRPQWVKASIGRVLNTNLDKSSSKFLWWARIPYHVFTRFHCSKWPILWYVECNYRYVRPVLLAMKFGWHTHSNADTSYTI